MAAEIVVGIDGSPSSEHALRWAVEEARLRGARLKVITAWEVPWAIYAGAPMPEDLVPGLEKGARELAARVVAGLGEAAEGVDIDTEALQGYPAHALIEAARGAQLLVVGSRGLGGFRELLLGSVSQQCAHHAPCPVVIVHRGL